MAPNVALGGKPAFAGQNLASPGFYLTPSTGPMYFGERGRPDANVLARASQAWDGTTLVGNDVPRTYGPSQSVIHMEAERTNLVLSSQGIGNTDWEYAGSGGITVDVNAGLAPDGSQSASRVYGTTDTGGHYVKQTITVASDTWYTFSFYAKDNGGAGAKFSVYDVTNGTDISRPEGVEDYYALISGSEWTRIAYAFKTSATTTQVAVYPMRDAGAGVDCLVWGAQLEEYAFPSSYIPTTTAATARAHESISRPISIGLSDFTYSMGVYSYGITSNYFGAVSAGGWADAMYYRHYGGTARFQLRQGGTTLWYPSGPSWTHEAWHVMTVTRENDVWTFYVDGTQVASTTLVHDLSYLTGINLQGEGLAEAQQGHYFSSPGFAPLGIPVFEWSARSATEVSNMHTAWLAELNQISVPQMGIQL